MNPQPKPTRAPKVRRQLRSRTPMKRGKPLVRTSWMHRKAPHRLSDPRQNDDARRDWTAHQVCIGVGRIPGHRCTGRIEVAHEGRKPGLALKCSDHQAVPACTGLHADWTNHAGHFKGWPKERRREWMDPIVDAVEASYLSAGSRRSTR